MLEIIKGEYINNYFGRVTVVSNVMCNYGELMTNVKIVDEILRTFSK